MACHRQQKNLIESLRCVRDFAGMQRWLKDHGFAYEKRGKHALVHINGHRLPAPCTPSGGNRAVMNMRADILRVLK